MIVAHSLETSIFGMGPQLNEGRWMDGWMELVLSSTTAAAAPSHSLGPQFLESGPSIFGKGRCPQKMPDLRGQKIFVDPAKKILCWEWVCHVLFEKKN